MNMLHCEIWTWKRRVRTAIRPLHVVQKKPFFGIETASRGGQDEHKESSAGKGRRGDGLI
jgi:hypothetical protein